MTAGKHIDNLILNDLMTELYRFSRLFWFWSFDFDSVQHIA